MKQNFVNIDSVKEGLLDYINSLISLYSPYMKDSVLNKNNEFKDNFLLLNNIFNATQISSDLEDLYKLKQNIIKIEEKIETLIFEAQKSKLTGREMALVERGYDIEDIIRLATFTEEQAQQAAISIIDRITYNCQRVNNPVCIFLGGQPGCGKSTASMNLKENYTTDGIVEIGIDNYRTYHPNYLEIEKLIKKHWINRKVNDNDSPGNDIADFTHNFAGRMTDIIIEMASKKVNNQAYNIVMEYGMRTPEGPLSFMEDLKNKGYKNIVNFIAVHKDISLEACKIRADIMNNQKHIVRRVPNSFHELACSTIANSCATIYREGYIKHKTIDDFFLTNRKGQVIWKVGDEKDLSSIYNEWLNNPEHSIDFINNPDLAKMAYLNEAYGFSDKQHNEFTGNGLKM